MKICFPCTIIMKALSSRQNIHENNLIEAKQSWERAPRGEIIMKMIMKIIQKFEMLNFDKKWLNKAELLEAHSQTVYTSEIYMLYCFDSIQLPSSPASKAFWCVPQICFCYYRSGTPPFLYLLGLRPRKASGAARPPLSFRFCYGLRGMLRTLKLNVCIKCSF